MIKPIHRVARSARTTSWLDGIQFGVPTVRKPEEGKILRRQDEAKAMLESINSCVGGSGSHDRSSSLVNVEFR